MPRSVAIVLTPDYSDELDKLAFRLPVWLIDTPANRVAAERVWLAAHEWPQMTVNLFRETEDWNEILRLIALQEPFDAVEVIGSPLSEKATDALEAIDITRVEPTPAGFRARRR